MSTNVARMREEQAPDRERRTLVRAWAAGCIVLALLAAVLVVKIQVVRDPKDGPLQGPMAPMLNGTNLAVGGTATWGSVVVTNRSDQDLTLRSLRLGGGIDGSDKAVRVTKVEVVDTRRLPTGGIGMAAGAGHEVIPAHVRNPLQGYRLTSGTTAALLVRYTVKKPGRWRLDRTVVRYEQDGRSYELEMPQALGVCAPADDACDVGEPPGLGGSGN